MSHVTCEWVMTHVWMIFIRMHKFCIQPIYIWISHVTYEWVMTHVWMKHGTNEWYLHVCTSCVWNHLAVSLSQTHAHTHSLSLPHSLSLSLARALCLSCCLPPSRMLALSLSLPLIFFPPLSSPPPSVSVLAQDVFLFFGINSPRTKYFPTFFYGYKKLQMCHW